MNASYALVVLFLLPVAVAAARSYNMIFSLIVLAFLPNRKPADESTEGTESPQSVNRLPE